MRIFVRGYLPTSPPWEQMETWGELIASLLEINRGRTLYVDAWAKLGIVYTITYHYWNPALGIYTPSSVFQFGPL